MFSGVKHIGTGQFYLFAMKDGQGRLRAGGPGRGLFRYRTLVSMTRI